MQQTSSANGIPARQFGRHDVRISALGFGGHHLGDAPDEAAAVRLVREAVDGGVTFFARQVGRLDGQRFERYSQSRLPDDKGLHPWTR
jgi:hypothetical protein